MIYIYIYIYITNIYIYIYIYNIIFIRHDKTVSLIYIQRTHDQYMKYFMAKTIKMNR